MIHTTKNSIICTYIQNHPDTWQEDFANLNITVHTDNNLAIFNYGTDCDFSNPIIQEARGIIIDVNTLTVLCWPFRKFGNWNESYADEIDWHTARVQEKIDGSIVKLWFNYDTNSWVWSSNSVIDAKNASVPHPTETIRTYADLIKAADNYEQVMTLATKNVGFTYIFELTSPMNEVVIHHNNIHLWHIGTRYNDLGTEMKLDLGISKPAEYPLRTFEECLEAVQKLNTTKGVVTHEGYVVVDANWHRIKIKSPAYLSVHHLLGNGIVTKDKALAIIENNLVHEIRDYPQTYVIVKWYEYQLAEFELTVTNYMAYARGLFNEVNQDRKALAAAIKNDPLSDYGFRAIGNDLTAKDLIAKAKRNSIVKFLKEYER